MSLAFTSLGLSPASRLYAKGGSIALGLLRPSAVGVERCRCYSKKASSSNTVSEKAVGPAKDPSNKIYKLISKSKLLTRLSKRPAIGHYFDKLAETSPVSTISSFLILHEITAIVPLFGLWWVLYSLNLNEQYELPLYFKELLDQCGDSIEKLVGDRSQGFDRNRLVLSGAISYAIVKILYPARVLFSLWAAPYFFKWFLGPFKKLGSLLRPGKKSS
ncbi:Mrx11p [Lachancea thermotolerans CBS 6340]|uniref:KLTH0E11374p n=1 Tax=Lachancea thermotolerans (strain ATCC 56472 / CBS 6340 / NRRL Y-8284) TaxID=559295 RepID=C5DIC2_LACTC|nr:KLTH0E11374p [Lachancea thermotolerans CBS 6340]CAR23533.1 KLTH0E11374p [Lachancea thermotolerans CBS 6340]